MKPNRPVTPAEVFDLAGHKLASPGHPDPFIVELLEEALARAKAGDLDGLVLATSFPNGSARVGTAGVITYALLGAAACGQAHLMRELDEED